MSTIELDNFLNLVFEKGTYNNWKKLEKTIVINEYPVVIFVKPQHGILNVHMEHPKIRLTDSKGHKFGNVTTKNEITFERDKPQKLLRNTIIEIINHEISYYQKKLSETTRNLNKRKRIEEKNKKTNQVENEMENLEKDVTEQFKLNLSKVNNKDKDQ